MRGGVANPPELVLASALDRVIADDSPAAGRLRYADTSVTFRVAGREPPVTLLLDRSPVEIWTTGDEPAEIEITLTPDQATRLVEGSFPLPAAVVTGAVTTSGPVRKFLDVDPILQRLLAHAAGYTEHRQGMPVTADVGDLTGHRVAPELCAIETRGLKKAFGHNQVLQGLDVTIPEGTISVLLGPSGTGKSVLLQHVIGIMKPDAGDVLIRGRALSRMGRGELLALRREIGVMFQDGALFSAMNVYDNVAFPLRQHTDLKESDIREVVIEHLRSVGLEDAQDRMPSQLSGGMRKRAGLARALVMEPGIVLCDEPDSGLDPVRTALLGDLLVEQHAQQGGTMVVVTHNVMLATRIADHISVVWRGRVLESGMAADVLASGTAFVQQFLAGESEGPLGMDA